MAVRSASPNIYSELPLSFKRVEDLGAVLDFELKFLDTPSAALLLAEKAFTCYRKQDGVKPNVLSDFFIGAYATVADCSIVMRDQRISMLFSDTVFGSVGVEVIGARIMTD